VLLLVQDTTAILTGAQQWMYVTENMHGTWTRGLFKT